MSESGFTTYQEALDWVHGLLRFGQKPGLERVLWMLSRLDHPERRVPFIHVAGTNGKGSTCAYLNGILQAAGYSTGMFTSPYLINFRERIRYNGEMISEEEFRMVASEIRPLAEECAETTSHGTPTEFEVITVIAIQYFARVARPAVVIWETGLGGRLDSTNVVHPLVSIITNIGMDHMDVLGHTIEEIAREKAGIIKPGVPVVTCEQSPDALAVIEQAARDKKSTLYVLNRDFSVEQLAEQLGSQTIRYESQHRRHASEYVLPLNGVHQPKNAAAALAALDVLRNFYAYMAEEEEIARGLQQTSWPGRLEVVSQRPLIFLDGAHNTEGMQMLTQSLEQLLPAGKSIELLVSSLADKPLVQMAEAARPLVALAERLTLTQFDFPRAATVEKLQDAYVTAGVEPQKLFLAPDWRSYVSMWKERAEADDCLVICGSLYFIAQVRAFLYNVEEAGE
ncbi:bifunctional folylpolyglutamate synthase/dihydrofolate synthase [Brevibacillus fluminis]|uniref:bifunctional folylpolyglutamate synthase/dihydrofolate synthase n=1 Tax=Brevibacillus fluminis TaxID=511487 RepID=UPI003F8CE768